MATRGATRRHPSNQSAAEPTKLIPVKGTPTLQRRLKIAAAEDGKTYAQLITEWLDTRDQNIRRRRAAQPSPLHRPRNGTRLDLEE